MRWQAVTLQVIERGRSTGELRRLDPVRAESLLTSVYFFTVYVWVNCNETRFELRDELRARLEFMLDGIAAWRLVHESRRNAPSKPRPPRRLGRR